MPKILGLDLGTKSLGMAFSNREQTLALPYLNFTFPPAYYALARAKVVEVVTDNEVSAIVIGLPFNEDGSKGERAASVERFVSDLSKVLTIPIYFQDERYSSIEAEENLRALGYSTTKIKTLVDQEAAKVILQTYLNKQKEQK